MQFTVTDDGMQILLFWKNDNKSSTNEIEKTALTTIDVLYIKVGCVVVYILIFIVWCSKLVRVLIIF